MARPPLPEYLQEQIKGLSPGQRKRIQDHYFANPHAWWRPTGKHPVYGGVESYLEALDDADEICRDFVLFGGNRGGKTATMVNVILGISLDKPYNPWFEGKGEWDGKTGLGSKKFFVETVRRPNVGLVILPKRVASKVFCPEMRKWAPRGSYRTRMGDSKFESEWEFKGYDGTFETGSRFSIFTIDQSVGQMEGETLDWIASDESFPMPIYNEGFCRFFVAKCQWLGFMTPAVAARWYVNRLYALPENARRIVIMHKESACKIHGIRGFREHSAIEADIRKVTPTQYTSKVEGKPQHSVGLIYKTFNPDIGANVIPESDIVEVCRKDGCVIYAGCDPAEARYNAMVWIAVTSRDKKYVIDELPRWDPGIMQEPVESDLLSPRLNPFDSYQNIRIEAADFCNAVLAVEKELINKFSVEYVYPNGIRNIIPTRVIQRYIDPRFSSRTGIGKRINLRQLYDQYGVHFDKSVAELNLMASHDRISQMFSGTFFDDERRSDPSLFVSDKCRNSIFQLMHYGNKLATIRGTLTEEYSEVVDDTYKDFPDAIRYVLSRNPVYVDIRPKANETEIIHRLECRGRSNGIFTGMD